MHRAPLPPRRQRLQRGRAGDRHRGAQVRRAPVPHLQQAGLGLRQPVHDLHELPAPGLREVPGAGLLVPDEPRAHQPVLRQGPHARRGARADRPAGQRDRHRGRDQPRGEGDQPDRPPALRGVRQGLHRQAVADRPHRAERGHHHPPPGPLHLRQPLLQRHLRGPAHRRLHRLADPDGRPPQHQVRLDTDFFDVRDEYVGKVPIVYTGPVDEYFGNSEGRLSWRTVDLEPEVVDGRRLPGLPGHELQRPGGPVHPDPRVQALPPRADLPARQDRDRARVLAVRRGGRRALLPDQHRRGPRRSC